MTKVFVLLLIFTLASSQPVEAKEARGATKRKVRSVKVLEVDIEDLVRAEDDPNFDEYLKEKQRREQVDQEAIQKHKEQRQAFEDTWEKGRLAFIKEREKQKRKMSLKAMTTISMPKTNGTTIKKKAAKSL